MESAKITISIDPKLLVQVDALVTERKFATRSQAVEKAIEEKLRRMRRMRLARECAKLGAGEEQDLTY